MPTLRKLYPDPLLRIHPDDANIRGIKDDDMVVVESARATVKVKAKVTADVIPRVVAIDFGWGNPWDRLKADVNSLVDDEPRCPVSSATSNRRFLCEVKKAS